MTLFCTICGGCFLVAVAITVAGWTIIRVSDCLRENREARANFAALPAVRRELNDIGMWCSHDKKIVDVCDRLWLVLNEDLSGVPANVEPIEKWRDKVSPRFESKLQSACGFPFIGDKQ